MPVRPLVLPVSISHAQRSRFLHRALLTGVCSTALLSIASGTLYARALNGGSAGGAVSAPNIAADAATQTAQRAATAAQQTQQSLARAARAVQDMQAIQAAARAAAAAQQTSVSVPVAVPNGLGAGGLLVAPGGKWDGANAPTQTVDANGQTQVGIRQLTQQAILEWQSFNVGARTTLTFDQQGNSSWVALNRVVGTTAPSHILGNIKADGHVYVINQNGIIFGGNSQINVGSLIASTAGITNEQFTANGIYGPNTPSFKAAGGKVVVEAGASIETRAPSSVTSGGGFVLMIGSQVENAGTIATPRGQTMLAAGDDFVLRAGFGSDANQTSTTRGNEISPIMKAGSTSGNVTNTGLIFAQQGDITMAGRSLAQNGVLIATTSVNTRGTIHLLNKASDTAGSIGLAAGSVSAILPELDSDETAIDSQRDALIKASDAANLLRVGTTTFDNLSLLADRQDQSRVEIVSGGTVTFKGGSITAAQGGQIAVSAKRIVAEEGATLDVSGVRGVALAMASNNVKISVQGNELRDSPQNRDSNVLKSNDVWIDVRSLTLVADGTGGYTGNRYYTKGGLLEVGGYLNTTPHTIGEWAAIGGSITLAATSEVIAQSGATFNISGGSLDYAAGWIRSTNLIGIDGRRYTVDNAPADMTFVGFAGSFSRTHQIQGKLDDRLTETWTTVFDRGRTSLRWEDAYSVGRDAGRLNLSTPTSIFAASIVADTVTGQYQTSKRSSAVADGYKLTQTTVAQNGTLALGQYGATGRTDLYNTDVRIADPAASGLPADRTNTAWFDAGYLSAQKLGGLDLGSRGRITIDAPVQLADGGVVRLIAPLIDIKADITARSGGVSASNLFTGSGTSATQVALVSNGTSTVTVHDGATIDVRGLWVNAIAADDERSGQAYRDGGSVSLQSSRDVAVENGAAIDTSSGAMLDIRGSFKGGKGGSISLLADAFGAGNGRLTLGGTLLGYGAAGGGTLTIDSGPKIVIGGAADAAVLSLDTSIFRTGFAQYAINGHKGVSVAPGVVVDVAMPTYQLAAGASGIATGGDPSAALGVVTLPLYMPNAAQNQLVQRAGASLSLQAGVSQSTAGDLASVVLDIGQGAVINVDPGQTIKLTSVGQLNIDGTLNAWGGNIILSGLFTGASEASNAAGHNRSIWLGDHAVLDVAARAASALDRRGRRYGTVANGGSIVIGGTIDHSAGLASAPDLFVVVKSGARLDASGGQAMLDIDGQAITVASNGGSISLASNNGLYLDGSFVANAGAATAAGGTLSLAMVSSNYVRATAASVLLPRQLIIAQDHGAFALQSVSDPAAAALVYGHGGIAVSQIAAGGFGSLNLLASNVAFAGNVDLNLRQNLQIYTGTLSLANSAPLTSQVNLNASYLRLAGYLPTSRDQYVQPGGVTNPSTLPGSATFSASADLIDARGLVSFGSRGATGASQPVFEQVTLNSRGDIRFLAAGAPNNTGEPTTQLITSGDVTLRAAQLYPTIGAAAGVTTGTNRTLTVGRSTTETPELPYSAFGRLRLAAGHVVQGGVVRAPLGSLEFGLTSTSTIDFLPGSITSVSGAGLEMPYGGTIDGQVWNYNGSAVSFVGAGGVLGTSLAFGVTLNAKAVDVQPGAVLDLSGGGALTGAGFVSGRGGSVDVLRYALADANPGYSYSKSGNQVYAIVPGHVAAYAPVTPDAGTREPAIGRQITLDGSTPGLPAGTYTLMPATYALLPGAFRVELTPADSRGLTTSVAFANGSYLAGARLSIANTGISESLARRVIVTSGATVRTHSLYDETSYANFAIADAVRRGIPRPMLPVDGKGLKYTITSGAGANSLTFDGTGLFGAATGGYDGAVSILANKIEVVAGGRQATPGFTGVTIVADELNALGASRLTVGGIQYVEYGQGGNYVRAANVSQYVYLRSGAVLSAPEVFLIAADPSNPELGDGLVRIEQGASINTLGRGKVAFDSNDGFIYAPQGAHFVAVSNGLINVAPSTGVARGGIDVGNCIASVCSGDTTLYSNGTIALSTTGKFELSNAVRYGTRNLSLAVGGINVGSTQSLADASARGVLPSGLILNQSVLDRLIAGDTSTGAPALETLILNASASMNFFGDVALDTYDKVTGHSTLERLVLTTPAIYGYGNVGTLASIRTKNLVFGGSTNTPTAVVANGAGTGSGALDFTAERIEFGFGPFTQPSNIASYDRLVLGFANVALTASDRITANHKGGLSVYQSQGAYVAGTGYTYSGGNLSIITPLFTGEAGSVNSITAGGTVSVTSPNGATAGAVTVDAGALGAQIALSGSNITLASAVVLPSGKLTLRADGDIMLTDATRIDMSGRTIVFNDIAKSSWGGDVVLESAGGNIVQAAGSRIDLSAKFNAAGTLRAVALDAAAGMVDLQGSILGSSSSTYDAGGVYMPYKAASVEIRAQRLGGAGSLTDQFAALNQRLNSGSVFGGRSFQLKQGDLVIGDGLKAGSVDVSLDGGQLTVTGTIDASGAAVGSIYLAAKNGLRLAGSAVLDAHGEVLRVDSYGKIIDSPNRAVVDLTASDGVLTLAAGARIDLRHGTIYGQNDGVARGTLELNAPRIGSSGSMLDADAATYGDIAIDASDPVTILGARSIAVNAMQRYTDAPNGTDAAVSERPYQVITQAWLKTKHDEATTFINAALNRSSVMDGKLAGLNNDSYRNAFHLRPGIEIASKTADGDLVVQGDLDLSGFRYNGVNPNFVRTGVTGSGEVGTLRFRAGGDLSIYGGINDGFALPDTFTTQDDKGWVLLAGIDFTGGNIIVPGVGVTLADGTAFPNGATLNYDLPVQGANLGVGMRLPAAAKLSAAIIVPAGTVLAAAIRDGAGNLLYAAGTLLSVATPIPAGTQLDAGSVMPVAFSVSAFVWPKGVALAQFNGSTDVSKASFLLDGDLALKPGSLIPSGTDVKLPGGDKSVELRPEVAGRQGRIWAVAPMLAEGSQSWSFRFVAGADLDAADGRRVQSHPAHGSIRLADSHYGSYGKAVSSGYVWSDAFPELEGQPITDADVVLYIGYSSVAEMCATESYFCVVGGGGASYALELASIRPSVVRTGTGDLQFFTGGNLRVDSLYGIYTAGTSSVTTSASDPYNLPRFRLMATGTVTSDANQGYEKLVDGGADSIYRAWYPTVGGDLTIKVGGDLTGDVISKSASVNLRPNTQDAGYNTADVANWLWRQGSNTVATGGVAQPTAWWINFGTYVGFEGGFNNPQTSADQMRGFTGFGTLGGGNLAVDVAGNAGRLETLAAGNFNPNWQPRSQGLVLAVGSTGRVMADGSLQLTGGGDLSLRVGGVLNTERSQLGSELNGTFTNLRGHSEIKASEIGSIDLLYGNMAQDNVPKETRAFDPFNATRGLALGGPVLAPGDATFSISTLRDQVLETVTDPGRLTMVNPSAFTVDGTVGKAYSWFTMWTDRTAIDLFSAGGNLTPYAPEAYAASATIQTDAAAVYPSIFRAVAATGSLYYGKAARIGGSDGDSNGALMLAPSPRSELQFLAGDSIYAGGYSVSQSSAAADVIPTPQNPAYVGWKLNAYPEVPQRTNVSSLGNVSNESIYPLFALGSGTAAGLGNANSEPARFYALTGDLVGVNSGRIIHYTTPADTRYDTDWYIGGAPVRMIAGRDIVRSGDGSFTDDNQSGQVIKFSYTSRGNLFVHNSPGDISIVSAGRDIIYSNFKVAGPGTLEVSAGRNILMEDKASITSMGPVVSGDTRPGASIAMMAGTGAAGADFAKLAALYLDPANQAVAGTPLAEQAGKVAKTYETELVAWLKDHNGFSGTVDQARAAFAALPAEQQRIFLREVYFAELREGGREYNNPASSRYQSYQRGRQMIATLFPETDAIGNPIARDGAITMFGDSGVRSKFGGDIQMLAPSGRIVVGLEGQKDSATSGIVTEGKGDVQVYAHGSVLLGLSRIMTTFGGNILAWSATGDINAGRGSKTTVLFTPPKRTTDKYGNVTLAPNVPSSGAGIATLNPIPEVRAGDIDLIAPLGTIDAGEAGIRVSGNVNLAALQILNAANIQVQGATTGIPTVQAPSITAALSSSNANTATQQNAAPTQAASSSPSVIIVEVLGYGGGDGGSDDKQKDSGRAEQRAYDPNAAVQVVGHGELKDREKAILSDDEQKRL